MLAYTHLCCRDEFAAEQLGSRAFALSLQQTLHDEDPHPPWRPRLFTSVHETAADWAAGSFRGRLDDRYAAFVADVHGGEPSRFPLADGFAALPAHSRTVLWHTLVEEETDVEVSLYTGERPADIPRLAGRARESFREACLRVYLERDADDECRGFGRILDVAARREDARQNEGLDAHLAQCPGCAIVLAGLIDLEKRPRLLVAEALLGWAGEAYLSDPPSSGREAPLPAIGTDTPREGADAPGSFRRVLPRPLDRPVLLGLSASAALAAVIAVVGLASGDSIPEGKGSSVARPTVSDHGRAVRGGIDADPSVPPPGSTLPSAERKPSETPGAHPSSPSPSASPSSPFGEAFTPVINAATDQCLGVRGAFFNGADVTTVPCRSGSPAQKWRFDSDGLVHNRADSHYCLDTRGHTNRGVGIWDCSHHPNLFFFVDASRRIRPRLAPDSAVVPDFERSGHVSFAPVRRDDAVQRWSAG